MKNLARLGSIALTVVILAGVGAGSALAHCDTVDGPVVTLAKKAVEAMEKKKHTGESVESGRAYVQAYVPFLHFVERLYNDATMPIAHGAGDVGGQDTGTPNSLSPENTCIDAGGESPAETAANDIVAGRNREPMIFPFHKGGNTCAT
jgi:hypothetical protein